MANERWIPVTDRLPEDGVWCWVNWDSPGRPFPALRDSRSAGGWTNSDTWEDFNNEVTHWVPLPEPPRESVPAAFAVYDCDGAFVSALETLQECEERYGRDTRNRYIPLYREAADEIARLRLTDEELENIDLAIQQLPYGAARVKVVLYEIMQRYGFQRDRSGGNQGR